MSVQDLMILRGRAASDVALHRSDEPEAKTFGRFRMAVPRSRRKDDGQWEEIEPQWYTIKMWGVLAEHVNLSLRRGAPVLVVGRPVAQAWINRVGEAQADLVIHAVSVGHDMVFGISSFSRLRRQTPELERMDEGAEDAPENTAEGASEDAEQSGQESEQDSERRLVEESAPGSGFDAGNLASAEVDHPIEEDEDDGELEDEEIAA